MFFDRTILIRSLFVFVFLFTYQNVHAEKWLPIGPQGGNIFSLVGHQDKPERLFASVTSAGLYVSDNSGDTWDKIPAFSNRTHFGALAIASTDSNTIYAGAAGSNEMFRSTDGGINWQEISVNLPVGNFVGHISQIIVDSSNSQHIVIRIGGNEVFLNAEIYQSLNAGDSWEMITLPSLNISSYITDFTLVSGRVALSVHNDFESGDGIYRQSTIDNSWVNITPNQSTSNDHGFSSIVSSNDGNQLFALGIDGIWISDNSGSSWSLQNSGLISCPIPGMTCDSQDKLVLADRLLQDPVDDQVMFAYQALSSFLWKSEDRGLTWQFINTDQNIQSLLSLGDEKLYLGDIGDGVFYNNFWSGNNWQQKSIGLNNSYVADFKINPIKDEDIIMASYYQGMLHSSNNGSDWSTINQGLKIEGLPESYNNQLKALIRPENLWVDHNNSSLMLLSTSLIGSNNGLYRTIDAGQSWNKIKAGLPSFVSVSKILRTSVAGSAIFLGSPLDGLFISNDEGISWQKSEQPEVSRVDGMTLSENGTLYVIAKQSSVDSRKLWRSEDQGQSFQQLNIGVDLQLDNIFTNQILANSALFVTTEIELDIDLNVVQPNKLFRSTNNGTSWQQMSFNTERGAISAIEIAPNDINTVYLGTGFDLTTDGEHLFKSTDNGTTFIPIAGDVEPLDIRHILANPHQPDEIYIATYSGGLYKSNLLPNINISAPTQTSTGATVQLDGSGSNDREGAIAEFEWQQTGGTAVTISNSHTAIAEFTAPIETSNLLFTLTVTDGQGESTEQDLEVIVTNNQLPTAIINAPTVVNYVDNIQLDGSGSNDSDGTIVNYQWTQLSGVEVSLDNSESSLASFDAPQEPGNLSFMLTITDNDGGQTDSSITIYVNQPPEIVLESSMAVTGGATVNISATIADSDSDIESIAWNQVSGPTIALSDVNNQQVTFIAPDQSATVVLSIQVTDTYLAVSQQQINIIITASAASDDSGSSKSSGSGALSFLLLIMLTFSRRNART
ncbi:MAG: hypothetical protein KUG78_05170 [Kangiellaceae bacterium]|nr:hypothetical protein [Kangiellaceae bacterium]